MIFSKPPSAIWRKVRKNEFLEPTITFLDENIDVDTFGNIHQSVVFTPVSNELLDKELMNFLENEIKNGK